MSELEEARGSFDRAVRFLRSGNAPMTERISRAALETYPGEVNFQALLGAALLRQGRTDEARVVLEAVVEAEPAYAKAHEQLGQVMLALGRLEDAVESFRRAVDLDPALEAAELQLGRTLLRLGREAEAQALFEAFVRRKPDRARLAAAARLYREGSYEAAERSCRDVLATDPDNVTALRLLAMIATKAEHYRDAVLLLKHVVRVAPDYRGAWIDLGYAQTEAFELEDAIGTFRHALALDPHAHAARVGLANALARSSRTAEAVAAYREAIAQRPEIAGTWLGLGNVLKTLGRQEEAIAAYRSGLERNPRGAELYWSLSNLKTFRFEAAEIEAMQAELARDGLDDNAVVHLSFALGKACEDAGDYAAAFRHYERGNRLRRAQEHYDPVQTEVMGERIRAVFTRKFVAAREGGGFDGAQPIFIVGLPRSGSTLLEQILASHPLVEATHELPEGGRLIRHVDRRRLGREQYPEALRSFGDEDFVELGRRYDRETQRYRHGAPRFIDKMPNNFANVGLLALALPGARFVNARRDRMDTCLSCYKQLFARGQSFTYDLEDLAAYYLEYRRMMEHWHEVLPGRVLDVDYESVVDDLEREARRLLDFCCLPWHDACLRFYETERPIRTASSEQVRQPIYRDAVGHWKRFGSDLDSLRALLGA
ncbi:MAG TPA: sulfotransferase [Woeseiaceae bacterium]|nr:sulfotransferase [Woeseiaceae bacterium]